MFFQVYDQSHSTSTSAAYPHFIICQDNIQALDVQIKAAVYCKIIQELC